MGRSIDMSLVVEAVYKFKMLVVGSAVKILTPGRQKTRGNTGVVQEGSASTKVHVKLQVGGRIQTCSLWQLRPICRKELEPEESDGEEKNSNRAPPQKKPRLCRDKRVQDALSRFGLSSHDEPITEEKLKQIRREKALKCHPDKGGVSAEFVTLQNDFEILVRHLQ